MLEEVAAAVDVAESAKEAEERIDRTGDEDHHQVTSVTNATKQDIGKQTSYSHHHYFTGRGDKEQTGNGEAREKETKYDYWSSIFTKAIQWGLHLHFLGS